MNKRLFLATTAVLVIATTAFAQSPSGSNSTSPTTQRQQDSNSTTPSNSATTQSADPSSGGSAQTQSGQSAAGQSSNANTSTSQAPASGASSSQTQTDRSNQANPPPSQAQTNSPNSGTQSVKPPASNNNQAQSPSGSGSSSTNTAQPNTAQQNSQQNTTDRSSNTNVNASVNINAQQRTRISTSISHLNVQPLNSVNFSLSVGTVVPRDVRLQTLPAEVVEIVPQYRGYSFVLVKDEIVIVEPSTYKIITVLPYSGRSTATAPVRTERKTTFTDTDRDVVRKHAKARPVERERRTTGSAARTEIRTGERVPEGVEIEAFPDEVYREAPALREYRYIHRDTRTYIIEPRERRIIEEID